MKAVFIDVEAAQLSREGTYALKFNRSWQTKPFVVNSEFPRKRINFFVDDFASNKNVDVNLELLQIDSESGGESMAGIPVNQASFSISEGKKFNPVEVALTDGNIQGTLQLSAKYDKCQFLESIQSPGFIFGLNLGASFIQTAKAFDMGIQIKSNSGLLVGKINLTDKEPYCYIDIPTGLEVGSQIEIKVWNGSDVENSIVFYVEAVGTKAVTIPSTSDTEPIVLVLNFVSGINKFTASIMHQNVLKKAVLKTAQEDGDDGPKIVVSKRNTVVGQEEADVIRHILYIEMLNDDMGESNLEDVEKCFREATDLSLESKLPSLPGAFTFCTSKLDKKDKKMKKRQLHYINQGCFEVSRSVLAPKSDEKVLMRAYVLEVNKSLDKYKQENQNPEISLPDPRTGMTSAKVIFTGHLEESNRETFADTGLTSVVMEGKCFDTASVLSPRTQKKAEDLEASPRPTDEMLLENLGSEPLEEDFAAIKIYMSFVQSPITHEDEQENSDSSTDESKAVDSDEEKADESKAVDSDKEKADESKAVDSDKEKADESKAVDSDEEKADESKAVDSDKEKADESKPINSVPSLSGIIPQSEMKTMGKSASAVKIVWANPGYNERDIHSPYVDKDELVSSSSQILQTVENNDAGDSNQNESTLYSAPIQLLQRELDEKQKMIASLLEENRVRSEAVQVLGGDIVRLREENIQLHTNLKIANDKHRTRDEEDKRVHELIEKATFPESLETLTKENLISILTSMKQKVEKKETEKQELVALLAKSKTTIDSLVDMKNKYAELQEAHMLQTTALQKVAQRAGKLDSYKATIEVQEKVIAKLQAVMELKLRAKGNAAAGSAAALMNVHTHEKTLEKEKEELSGVIDTLTQRIQALEQDNERLAAQRFASIEGDLDGTEGNQNEDKTPAELQKQIDALEAEITSRDFRISALESQLESSTRDYSKEIARLRTRIFELETDISANGINSDMDDIYADMDVSLMDVGLSKDNSQGSVEIDIDGILKASGSGMAAVKELRNVNGPMSTSSSATDLKQATTNMIVEDFEPDKNKPINAVSISGNTSSASSIVPSESGKQSIGSKSKDSIIPTTKSFVKELEFIDIDKATFASGNIRYSLTEGEPGFQHCSLLQVEVHHKSLKPCWTEPSLQFLFPASIEEASPWESTTLPIQNAGAVVQWVFQTGEKNFQVTSEELQTVPLKISLSNLANGLSTIMCSADISIVPQ